MTFHPYLLPFYRKNFYSEIKNIYLWCKRNKLYLLLRILRGRAGVARWAHNPKVTSSNLVPATQKKDIERCLF